jgi:AmpE protein
LSYLAFLSFIAATGLYWLMGPGGPLHTIDFLSIFRSQISDEDEGSSARTALILVVAPAVVFALLYILVEGVFGGAAMLLLGTAALFFAFGREDFPTLTQRFLARARVGDNEGAAMVIESAGGDSSADDVDDFGDVAASFFSVMALQRWFGPVIYFLLLGPVGAVAYRLALLTQETKTPLSDSLMRLLEWLPSRLLVLSFSVFGDFDKSIEHLTGKGMTLDVDTGDFMQDAVDAAVTPESEASVYDRLARTFHLLERSFLLWLGAVALLVLI